MRTLGGGGDRSDKVLDDPEDPKQTLAKALEHLWSVVAMAQSQPALVPLLPGRAPTVRCISADCLSASAMRSTVALLVCIIAY